MFIRNIFAPHIFIRISVVPHIFIGDPIVPHIFIRNPVVQQMDIINALIVVLHMFIRNPVEPHKFHQDVSGTLQTSLGFLLSHIYSLGFSHLCTFCSRFPGTGPASSTLPADCASQLSAHDSCPQRPLAFFGKFSLAGASQAL